MSAMETLGTRVVRGAEPLKMERTGEGRIRVTLTPTGDTQLVRSWEDQGYWELGEGGELMNRSGHYLRVLEYGEGGNEVINRRHF